VVVIALLDYTGWVLADIRNSYRKIGRSREEARREERENGIGSSANPNYDDDDDDMQL
jgi:hypothetical protein